MPMLLVWRLHIENHCSRSTIFQVIPRTILGMGGRGEMRTLYLYGFVCIITLSALSYTENSFFSYRVNLNWISQVK